VRTPSTALLARATAPLAAATLLFAFSAPAGAEQPADRGAAKVTSETPTVEHVQGTTPDTDDNKHPSGKDRTVENGGSGTQGRSASDPDGTDNEGPDKAGYDGGLDKADQDGNNGCGNDDDFEDDNRGNCLGREGAPGQAKTPGAAVGGEEGQPSEDEELDGTTIVGGTGGTDATVGGTDSTSGSQAGSEEDGAAVIASTSTVGGARVLGSSATRSPSATAFTPAGAPKADVLGSAVTRQLGALAADGAADSGSDSGFGSLPRTGVALATMALLGLALAGIGTVVTRLSRSDAAA
jgi:hypothetical protein